MGILSGLKRLGLGNLENVDIYESEKEESRQKAKKTTETAPKPKPEEKDLIYERSYTCPVCGADFTTKVMKSGKARLVGADQDLRPRYDVIDSLKYDVVLCPVCAYAALANSFTHVSPGQTKLIREKISASARISNYHNDTYSYEQALERYQLALASAVVKRAKASEKAYICLKTGWLIRGYAESLKDAEQPPVSVEELNNHENEYLENAYKGFLEARQSENFPMCGMDELTMDYLLAALAMRFQHYDVAGRLISTVLTSSSASARVKDKARDMKEQVLQELKKR
ncbi:MAG: DUF2225 domain-containing protein [Lachnospiraceae bacterium]|nr:DUF2225 domain-containing protein [Lachnospiraceae bacterium]